jgi:hypothetical protein
MSFIPLNKIQDAADGPIWGVRGVIAKIFPLDPPTEKQQAKGIHCQSILLQDGDAMVKVKLQKPEIHIDPGSEGRTVSIMSGRDQNDHLKGVGLESWDGKRYLSVWDGAQIVVEDRPEQRPPQAKGEPAPPSAPDLDMLAAHHRACFEAVKGAYGGSGVPIENLTSIATSLFIDTKNAARFAAKATPEEETTQAESEVTIKGVAVRSMTDDQIARLVPWALRRLQDRKADDRSDAVLAERGRRNISWTECASHYKAALIEKFGAEPAGAKLKATMQALKLTKDQAEKLAQMILADQVTVEGM